MDLVRASDPAVAAAEWIARHLSAPARKRFSIAVSGGSTPARMLRELAAHPLPWDRVDVFQVDERVAPDGHRDRNAGQLTPLISVGARVHLMPVTDDDLVAASARYATLLPDVIDIVHLGIGDDGHTASWPPGVDVDESVPVTIVGPYRDRVRMTLTEPVVNRAGEVMFLAPGADKRPWVERVLAGDDTIPAGRVRHDHTTIIVD
jgi:6-phosphogluconolactonase